MTNTAESFPSDLAAAHAMILAERAARLSAESDRRILDIEIERLKLEIARLRRERYGQSAERGARIEQLELALEDLEETAAAEAAVSDTAPAQSRRKPARRPFPDHLPRIRVVEPAPSASASACPCCGGELSKLGEDVTETLQRIPAQWRVICRVREKFACRTCQTITQPPAPFHSVVRGRAGAGLLAEVVFKKFGLHLPLHSQSGRFAASPSAAGTGPSPAPMPAAGGRRAAALYTLIETCKMNGVDPHAWLADVLDRLPGHPAKRIDELLPWNWRGERHADAA